MAGFSGYSTVLKKGGTSGTTVGEIRSLGVSMSRGSIDVSSMDSSDYQEFIPQDLYDPGEITLEVNWDPGETTHQALMEDMTATATSYAITWADDGTTTWEFNAFVTGLDASAPWDDRMSANATLKITGEITVG